MQQLTTYPHQRKRIKENRWFVFLPQESFGRGDILTGKLLTSYLLKPTSSKSGTKRKKSL